MNAAEFAQANVRDWVAWGWHWLDMVDHTAFNTGTFPKEAAQAVREALASIGRTDLAH